MWSPNHPISHHTSHTMGNGASSSNSGAESNGPSAVGHHTSHTMGNGASSSSSSGGGIRGNGGSQDGDGAGYFSHNAVEPVTDSSVSGRPQDTVLEATLTNPASEQLNFTPTPNELDDDNARDVSSMCSSTVLSRGTDESDDGNQTDTTSMRSSNNLSNFRIIDTTLREGEQFATAYFTTEQKIKIAKALDEFGVEYLELTSPAASPQSKADCATICKLGLKAKILCHIRCNMDDARAAVETGVDGMQLMSHSHGKDLDWIAEKAKEVIAFVQANNIEVRFSGEDSFRSDFSEILKLYSLCDRLGANRVGIADTVGGATPREVYEKISTLREIVDCDIGTHFHNDTGCAIANARTALEAGATHVDTTVLGIGERNGITSLGGLVKCLMYNDPKYIQGKYKLEKLPEIERLVAEAVSIEVPFNAPKIANF
ncbi:homocitrate synthase [Fusarium albosuccineum]|uniref:Homocitrate synthase n=1 Tax=Fusarium albosuccineum TaxID=1237068 RepID=A0A8H4KHB0_9HYPO|nr:homocitrate synthase [Fusarium albosuccineum]